MMNLLWVAFEHGTNLKTSIPRPTTLPTLQKQPSSPPISCPNRKLQVPDKAELEGWVWQPDIQKGKLLIWKVICTSFLKLNDAMHFDHFIKMNLPLEVNPPTLTVHSKEISL